MSFSQNHGPKQELENIRNNIHILNTLYLSIADSIPVIFLKNGKDIPLSVEISVDIPEDAGAALILPEPLFQLILLILLIIIKQHTNIISCQILI